MSEPPKENRILEKAPSSEVLQTVKGLVREVQGIITGVYGLKDMPDAAEKVWEFGDAKPKEVSKEEFTPNPRLYTFSQNGRHLKSLIYFPSKMMEKLANSTFESRLKGDCLSEMIGLIEETSHYIYLEFYRKKYDQEAHHANVELIGAIDKYNILQALFRKNFQRPMNDDESNRAFYEIALAQKEKNWPGDRPANYIIGHELGKQYILFLNNLYNNSNRRKYVPYELSKFYHMSNKEQIEHLFELGFTVETRTLGEKDGVQKVFREIGVNPHHKPLGNS